MAKFSTVKTDVQDTKIHGDDLTLGSISSSGNIATTGSLTAATLNISGLTTLDSLNIHDSLTSGHSSTGNMLVTGSLAVTGSISADTISSQNKISFWQSQNGGWKDIVGAPTARRAAGPTVPVYTQMNGGAFYAYKFAVGDVLNFVYHIPHDWAVGSPLFLHTHWTADLTSANTVKWEFTYDTAKGYSRGIFSMTGSVVTVEQAMTGAIWTHKIAEVVTPQDNSIETDGILLVAVKRITNGATECTSSIFLVTADCHYQATQLATKNRNYPFD